MSRLTWENLNGLKVLVAKYNGVSDGNDMIKILDATHEATMQEGRTGQRVRIVADFTDSIVGNDYMNRAKAQGKEYKNEGIDRRTALLGITGIKKTLLTAYILATGDRNIKAFNSLNDAQQWLAN